VTPPPRPDTDDSDPVRRLLAQEVLQAARTAGLAEPARDGRLDRAADDIARTTGQDSPALFDMVAFLTGHYGIVEAEPELLFARGGPHAEQEIADVLRPQVIAVMARNSHTRLGVGVHHGKDLVVVVAFQESHLELRAVPRSLTPGLVARLDGRLLHGYHSPQVLVTGPTGDVLPVSVRDGRGGRFEAAFGCRRDRTGGYQLEIVAETERGPEMMANFPVYCGVAPPTVSPPLVLQSSTSQDPATAEQEMVGLINRARVARGLSTLRLDRRLSEVARAHSQEMASTNLVAHVSPRTGNAGDRLKKAGISVMLWAENVGTASSTAAAHRGFMSSPGHRANVVEPRVSAIGVGVAAGAPVMGRVPLYFTELFVDGL
jgi:uncharacterized protein YkwD